MNERFEGLQQQSVNNLIRDEAANSVAEARQNGDSSMDRLQNITEALLSGEIEVPLPGQPSLRLLDAAGKALELESSRIPKGFDQEIFNAMQEATNEGFTVDFWLHQGDIGNKKWFGFAHRPNNPYVAGGTNTYGFEDDIEEGRKDLHEPNSLSVRKDLLTSSNFRRRYEVAPNVVREDHMTTEEKKVPHIFISMVSDYFMTATLLGTYGSPLSAFIQPAMFGSNIATNRSLRFFQRWENGQVVSFFNFHEGSVEEGEKIQDTYDAIQNLNPKDFEDGQTHEFSVFSTDVWGKPFKVTVEFQYLPDPGEDRKYTASFKIDRNPELEA